MKKTQLNCSIAALPTAINAPRKINAKMMPTNRANCWSSRGTFSFAMMMTKMNRLSIERLYSVIQPAKNSPAYCGPESTQTPSPKRIARLTKMPMKMLHSLVDGSCGRRPRMRTSTSSTAVITPTVMIQV